MDQYLDFAEKLARQAGLIIKDNFEKNLTVELKADRSPVTQVDKEINQLVIDRIEKTYPTHGVLGEEGNYGTGNEEFQWLCDPMDGTKAFVLGVPLNTFILGLFQADTLVMSVLYYPYQDRVLRAVKGKGAFANGRPLHVNQETLASGGVVVVSESSFKFAEELVKTGAHLEPLPGAGYRTGLVPQGRVSATIQGSGDYHDTGPCSLIVEEAGGKVTDLFGKPIDFRRPLENGVISSNGVSHDEMLKAIANKL